MVEVGAIKKWRFGGSNEEERGNSGRVFGVAGEVLFVAIRGGCGWRRRVRGGGAIGGGDELGSRECSSR